MYSPFGGGAVVGLRDLLDNHIPEFYGGGIIETVTDYGVFYTDSPDLYEAGSPNYPGVVGMLKAIEILQYIGFNYIEAHEKNLLKMAIEELSKFKEVTLYGDSVNYNDRVGIVSFTIDNLDNETVSQELADYSAISVRQAAFCAHPYVRRLTKTNVEYDENGQPLHPKGTVRVSFGIYNSEKDVESLIEAIKEIINRERTKRNQRPAYLLEESCNDQYVHLFKIPHDRG